MQLGQNMSQGHNYMFHLTDPVQGHGREDLHPSGRPFGNAPLPSQHVALPELCGGIGQGKRFDLSNGSRQKNH